MEKNMNHILLIDDDADMLAMTGRWLEKAGYRVTKAVSGKMHWITYQQKNLI